MPGTQRHHGLPQFVGVPPMQRVRGAATVCLPRRLELFCGQAGQRNGVHLQSFGRPGTLREFLDWIVEEFRPRPEKVPPPQRLVAATSWEGSGILNP